MPHAPYFEGWDTFIFLDNISAKDQPKLDTWDEVVIIEDDENPVLQSRLIKIKSHQYLPNYDLVCYYDAHQRLRQSPPDFPMWCIHPHRTTIFEEARQIIKNKRFPEDNINEMMTHYIDAGYVDHGLYLNGFFVRRHAPKINDLHEVWFDETALFVPRDQLTLPVAIWKTQIMPEGMIQPRVKMQYCIVKYPHKQEYKV